MKPRTLPIDAPIFDLAVEVFHTSSILRSYPFLQAHAERFDALYPEWLELLQGELAIQREQSAAEARAIVVDDGFDFLCVAISASLLAAGGGNRKSPIYQRYFGGAPPSKLKRPVLGQQLETMRTWPPSLTSPDSPPVLQEYGRQLTERVIEADQAVIGLSEAARKRADFEIGPRKAFVDKLNALRLSVYGQLAEMPHKHPEQHLSRDFADRFFLRSTGNRKPTTHEVEQTILRLRERLRKQEELLERMMAEEEAAARQLEDAELAAAEQALAELERLRDEAEARVEAARSRLTPADPHE